MESTTLTKEQQEQQERTARASALRRRLEGDYAPVAILAAVMVVLAAQIARPHQLACSQGADGFTREASERRSVARR